MTNMIIPDARDRLRQVAAALTTERDSAAIRFGFAELGPRDSAAELIARADSELIDGRA